MVAWHHILPFVNQSSFAPTGGFVGVDVFFVLSGFLITTLLLDERRSNGTIGMRRFYSRRALRLFPALYVMLIVHAAVAATVGWSLVDEAKNGLLALTYTSNLAPVLHVTGGQIFLWSLAIEEQFYLVWPVTIVWLARRRVSTAAAVMVATIVGCIAWRWHLLGHGVAPLELYQRTDTRVDGLLIGALVALAYSTGWRPRRAGWRVAGALALAVLAAVFATGGDHADLIFKWGFSGVDLAAAVLLVSVLEGDGLLARALASRPAVVVGRRSYSMYLWHVLMLRFAEAVAPGPLGVRLAIGVVAGFGCASISYALVERQFLALRDAGRRGRRSEIAVQATVRRDRRHHPVLIAALATACLLVFGSSTALAYRRSTFPAASRSQVVEAAADVPLPQTDSADASAVGSARGGQPPSVESADGDTSTATGTGRTNTAATGSKHPSHLVVAGPQVNVAGGDVRLQATLSDDNGPLGGKPVAFELLVGDSHAYCTAITNDLGMASCAVAPPTGSAVTVPTGSTVSARFDGDERDLSSSARWPT
jgi:peptidoglycan/LPS O-acetylase OafA/YrhL